MKRLDCVVDGCTATIEADSVEEVLSQAQEHARTAHPDLELDARTVSEIRSRIRDV